MSLTRPCHLSPEDAFARLRGLPGCAWLDSGPERQSSGGSDRTSLQRYSVLAAHPGESIRAWGRRIERRTAGGLDIHLDDSLGYLEHVLRAPTLSRSVDADPAPFAGGAIGHFSYEFGRRLLGQRDDSGRARPWPDYHFNIYPACYVYDHATGQATLRAIDTQVGAAALEILETALQKTPGREPEFHAGPDFTANRSREDYLAAVASIREAIAAGEIYQANLAQFFSTPASGDPATLFNRLRSVNPAPFSAYLDQGDRTLLSSSPELFLRTEGDRIWTRPIKGTRPRGADDAEDAARREALLNSEKERAELLMIVDMERNDLGRLAKYGSVQVNELYHLESYATVHHLIGEVEARLRPGVTLASLLQATFPGGSITGAPKWRAMEIIARHEPTPRDVFCGAIGWLGFNGDLELNIAIRTITCQEGRADFGVGAGIVWDSEPESEYEETLHKAKALFTALRGK